MKRLRVMQFLCCLSLMLFVTCSEAFSIKASASSLVVDMYESYALKNQAYIALYTGEYFTGSGQSTGQGSCLYGDFFDVNISTNIYSLSNAAYNNVSFINYNPRVFDTYPVINNLYDYYLIYNLVGNTDFNYTPDQIQVIYYDGRNQLYDYTDFEFLPYSVEFGGGGFQFSCKLDFTDRIGISAILLKDSDYGSVSSNLALWLYILPVPKDSTSDYVQGVIAAINNQTSELGSAIGGAADQVTDKIDEVLTPDGEHNFDAAIGNVNDKINENMGALGFAHDTVAQFADLFTETPGAPVITVPPLKMSIKGQEYEFFHGYQFDFRSMETGALGVLVTAVRTTGTIVLWLAFLYYCSNEFNKFFRG